ncbi:hypothetical protein HMPREF3198_02102 [Winkia neuii]|nr:hypothetical protein HMPREF3198_02102 [Winkia neuii]
MVSRLSVFEISVHAKYDSSHLNAFMVLGTIAETTPLYLAFMHPLSVPRLF